MQIPLVDLYAQYETIKHEVMSTFEDVLGHMQLFLGPQLKEFEQEFAAYWGCQYGVGLSSGTDALALALRACAIGPGDEVITVANTFIATIEAIAMVGATPVFIDVDPETYTMNWRQLERMLTSRCLIADLSRADGGAERMGGQFNQETGRSGNFIKLYEKC